MSPTFAIEPLRVATLISGVDAMVPLESTDRRIGRVVASVTCLPFNHGFLFAGLIGVVVVLVWAVRCAAMQRLSAARGDSLAVLQERYAVREIGAEAYRSVRSKLIHRQHHERLPFWRDHTLLVGSLMTLIFSLLALAPILNGTSSAAVSTSLQPATRTLVASPWQGQASGQVHQFKMTGGRFTWDIHPGKVAEACAYNRQTPGPERR